MSSSSSRVTLSNYIRGQNPFLKNYVKNESCLVNAADISASNTTVSRNTTTPLTAIADCQATLDSASDSFSFDVNTIDRSLYGQNCEARLSYKMTLGSGNTVKAQVLQNSAVLAEQTLGTANNGLVSLNFPCGDGTYGTVLRITQTAGSSSQNINVANAYVGAATNVGSVAQAELFGTLVYSGVSNCAWQTNSTSRAAFSADTDCATPTTTGNASAPGTKIPGITFISLPAGQYLVVATGSFKNDNSAYACNFSIYDGTSDKSGGVGGAGSATVFQHASLSASFSYTAAQSNITFQIRAISENAANNCQIQNQTGGIYTGSEFRMEVYRFPTSSEIAYRPEQIVNTSTLKYAGTTNCVWETTSASFAAFAADTDCPTPSVTGNATAPGTKIPGVTIASLPAGKYMVTTQANFYATVAADQCRYELYDGTNSSGFVPIYNSAGVANNNGTIVGIFSYTALQSNITFQVRGLRSSGSGNCQIRVNDSTESFQISVIPLDRNPNAPLLVGSVTSSSTGAERIERVKVMTACTGSPCTLTSNTPGITSVTRNTTGIYTINFASGTFTAAPTCTFSGSSGSQVFAQAYAHAAWTATAVQVTTWNSGLNGIDGIFDAICVGPRT